jgi:uridine kinase
MIKLKINNKEVVEENKISLEDLALKYGVEAYCAKVNYRIRELSYMIEKDCEIEFLDLKNVDAMNVYSTSLRYLITMAIKNIYPKARVIINYSLSRSFFIEVQNVGPMNYKILGNIKEELDNIIRANYPVKRIKMKKEEALKIYESLGYDDKVKILAYRPEDTVHFYECNGYLNYMFGYMVPKTGYIKEYNLRLYDKGFVLQYPRAEAGGIIPEFKDAPTFSKALRQANHWGRIINGSYVAMMNQMIEEGRDVEFINLCETKHNAMLAELGTQIKNNIESIKLIAIAIPIFLFFSFFYGGYILKIIIKIKTN